MSILQKYTKPSCGIVFLYTLMAAITFNIAFNYSSVYGQADFDRCVTAVRSIDRGSCEWYKPGAGNAFVAAVTWPFYLTYRLLG